MTKEERCVDLIRFIERDAGLMLEQETLPEDCDFWRTTVGKYRVMTISLLKSIGEYDEPASD